MSRFASFRFLLLALAVAGLGGCGGSGPRTGAPEHPMLPIATVIERRAPELMNIPGVVGVAEGETRRHEPCIRIMVAKRTPALEAQLPRTLDGYPVEIDETGVIRPLQSGG